jgi:hypothetical protein
MEFASGKVVLLANRIGCVFANGLNLASVTVCNWSKNASRCLQASQYASSGPKPDLVTLSAPHSSQQGARHGKIGHKYWKEGGVSRCVESNEERWKGCLSGTWEP